jgi:hypothetical protein
MRFTVNRAFRLGFSLTVLLLTARWALGVWWRVDKLLLGDLDVDSLYSARFQTYIMTQNCSRNFDSLVNAFPNSIIVNDEACGTAMPPSSIALASQAEEIDPAVRYKVKYEKVLRACAEGDKMLCLILEDDAVLVNGVDAARERLVRNTLSQDTNDLFTWDCSKYGLGFMKTGFTGNKSVCRIIPASFASCVSEIMEQLVPPFYADLALRESTKLCGLKQSRFLLVQHAGYKSTLGHVHNQVEKNPPAATGSPPPQQYVRIPPH